MLIASLKVIATNGNIYMEYIYGNGKTYMGM